MTKFYSASLLDVDNHEYLLNENWSLAIILFIANGCCSFLFVRISLYILDLLLLLLVYVSIYNKILNFPVSLQVLVALCTMACGMDRYVLFLYF